MTKTARTIGDIYEVHVEGVYYSLSGGKKDMKPYQFTFKADESAKKKGFCSTFRNALTPKDGEDGTILKLMKKKYPDYKRFKTHIVTETINLTEKGKPVKELNLMNRAQIVRFLEHRGYPVDHELYQTVTELRQAIRDFRENPVVFEKNQEKRRLTKGPDIAVFRALEYLNSEELDTPKAQVPLVEPEDETAPASTNQDGWVEDDDDFSIPEYDIEDELAEMLDGI